MSRIVGARLSAGWRAWARGLPALLAAVVVAAQTSIACAGGLSGHGGPVSAVAVAPDGRLALTGSFDWVTLSPKKFKPPVEANYEEAHELKVIVFNRSDLEWALTHAERCPPGTRLSLQPEWSAREKVMPLIVEFVKEHPEWTISLQTHKYLQVP